MLEKLASSSNQLGRRDQSSSFKKQPPRLQGAFDCKASCASEEPLCFQSVSLDTLSKSRATFQEPAGAFSMILFGQPQLCEFRAAPCESLRPRALQGCARGTRQGRWAAGPLSRWAAGPLSNGAAEQLNRWAAGPRA